MNDPNYKNIPAELRSLPRWVGFFRTPARDNKTTKKPVNPHTLYGASSTNPKTWGTFEEALSAIGKTAKVGDSEGIVEGVGFVFAPPYCGIDLDHVIDPETGGINPQALDIINTMDSYTEISPSGSGIHIIYKGEIHKDWKCKRADALGIGSDIEMYQEGRYFTVTGKRYNSCNVEERDLFASLVHKAYMQQEQKKLVTNISSTVSVNLPESEILEAARNSSNGMRFSELFAGNWQGHYGSQSEADIAFCSMLAFWFGRDFDRMDSVFRKSGLMRDKWDRKQSGSTYGAITLKKAISECKNVYRPSVPNDDDFSINIKLKKHRYYSFDDTGNAQRLFDMFGEKIRYNYNDRRWMIYDKNKWIYDITGYIFALIDKSVEAMKSEAEYYEKYDAENDTEMKKDFEKHMKKARNNNSKAALEKEVRHYVPVTPNALQKQNAFEHSKRHYRLKNY